MIQGGRNAIDRWRGEEGGRRKERRKEVGREEEEEEEEGRRAKDISRVEVSIINIIHHQSINQTNIQKFDPIVRNPYYGWIKWGLGNHWDACPFLSLVLSVSLSSPSISSLFVGS